MLDLQQFLNDLAHNPSRRNWRMKHGSICPSECSLPSNATSKHVCRPSGPRWRVKGLHVTGGAQTE